MQIHPDDLVVGDVVVMKPGDGIPADGLLFVGEGVKSNESGLTGEPDDLTKKADMDCFLFSRCGRVDGCDVVNRTMVGRFFFFF